MFTRTALSRFRVPRAALLVAARCNSVQIVQTNTFQTANDRLHNNNKKPTSLFVQQRYGSSFSNSSAGGDIQFNLADVGEGIAECEVLEWYVTPGQEIQEFDRVCLVQSDKATAEITSPYKGLITKLYYKLGDMAKVGAPLVDIRRPGGASEPVHQSQSSTTDELSSPNQSFLSGSEDNEELSVERQYGAIHALATPAVRRIAREKNINLNLVKGSGKDGRVLKEDVLSYESNPQSHQTSTSTQSKEAKQQQQHEQSHSTSSSSSSAYAKQEDRDVPITGITKKMVQSMTAACKVPHFGYCDEFTTNQLRVLREQMKPIAAEMGVKLSYMPFFLKACSLALREYPELNAHTNEDCSVLTVKGSHNIGVAMDTPQGLIVPNIKNVQDLSIIEIAKEINRLQQLGKEGKLTVENLKGGTFTISNIGAIGGTYASPVLFLPQVAIGAIGRIQKVPRYDAAGNIYPAEVIQFSWSADHRVVDGAKIARFSNLIKQYVENPTSMLISLR